MKHSQTLKQENPLKRFVNSENSVVFFSLENMAVLIKAGESKRGKPSIIDKNNYSYVGNGGTETTIYWRRSLRPCT